MLVSVCNGMQILNFLFNWCVHLVNDPSYYINVVLTDPFHFVSQETKLSAVCERVLDRCLAPTIAIGDGCDNMTMILVQFKKLAQFSAPT